MKLDRNLQRSILLELRENYPSPLSCKRMASHVPGVDFNANLCYLEEHGLISGKSIEHRQLERIGPEMLMAKITAIGLDFLEDDGGLRAILNKVTVTFDKEDLSALVAGRLEKADISPEKKSELMKTISSLPSEGIKTVYKRLVDLALDKAPDALDLIQNILRQAL